MALPAVVAGGLQAAGYTGKAWGLAIGVDRIYTNTRRNIRQLGNSYSNSKTKLAKDEQKLELEQPVFASKGKHSDIHDPDDIGKAFTKEMRANWRRSNDMFSGTGIDEADSSHYALNVGWDNKGNRGPRDYTGGANYIKADKWLREMGMGAQNPISGETNRPALHSRDQPPGWHNHMKMEKPERQRHGTVGGFRAHNYRPKRRSKPDDIRRGRLTDGKMPDIHGEPLPKEPFGGKKEAAMNSFLKGRAAKMHEHRTDVDYKDFETRYDPFHDYTEDMPKTPKPWDRSHYKVQKMLGGKKQGPIQRVKNWLRPQPVKPLSYGAVGGAIDAATGALSIASIAAGSEVGMATTVLKGKRSRRKKSKNKTGLPRNFDPGGA